MQKVEELRTRLEQIIEEDRTRLEQIIDEDRKGTQSTQSNPVFYFLHV